MLDYVPRPDDRRRWSGLKVGCAFLALCGLLTVADIVAITCLGTNATNTFSTVGPPPGPEAAPAPRSVPTRR
jgi:hypothetical protein